MTQDPSVPRAVRFARNFRWSLLGQAAALAVGLTTTPIILSHLGTERYGLYILIQTAANYLSLLSFGAGAATVKYIAGLRAVGDGRGVRKALRTSLFFHGPAVLAGAILLALGARTLLARVFHVPSSLLDEATFIIGVGAAGAVFASLTQCANSALQGLQRFEAQSTLLFLQGSLMTVGAAALVVAGFGLGAVAGWYTLWNGAVAVLALAWLASVVRRQAPASGPGLFSERDFAVWSVSQWLGQIAWIIYSQFDRVFAARYATLTGLTLYAVPSGLLQRLAILPATLSAVLIPMMSELHLHRDGESLRRLYLRSTRLLFALGLPILVLLFCLMPQFLSLWLGGDFGDRAVWPARVLVAAQFFVLMTALPNTAAFAQGRPWYIPALNWAQAVASTCAWLILARRWGLIGIAWGALLAQALPGTLYAAFIHRRVVKVGVGQFLSEGLFAPAAAAACLFGLVFPLHAWAGTWLKLVTLSGAGIGLYGGICWLLVPAGDRDSLIHYVSRRSNFR